MAHLWLLLISIYIRASVALIGYDCSTNSGKFFEVSLVDVQPCSKTTRNITKKEEYIQIVQPKVFDQVKYHQCLIEIDHYMFRCGKTIDTMVTASHQLEFFELKRDECKELIATGRFKYMGFTIQVQREVNVNTISLETIGSIYEGSCNPGQPITINGIYYDRPVRTSLFKVKTKKGIGSIDLEESKIITEEGLKCNYHLSECFSADEGNTFWEVPFNKPLCGGSEFLPIFEGPATHVIEYSQNKKIESYILHYDKYDFQVILTGRTSRTCGQVSYQTEHPKLSVMVQEMGLPFSLKYDPTLLGKNANLFTYINSKLVYTITHIKDQIENLYSKLMFDKCQANNKIIHNMMSLAIISPHQFAYLYFGTEGYTASIRGETVYVVKCNPVSVNYTSDGTVNCYQEIPVRYGENLFYMAPRTRLLHHIGTIVECSTMMPIKYKIQDSWFSISPGGVMVTKNPDTITIESADEWEFQDITHFSSAGIYSEKEIDKIEKIMLNSLNHEAVTAQMARSASGGGLMSGAVSVTNMMTIEELENLGKSKLAQFWDSLLAKLGSFGNFVSAIMGIIFVIKTIQFIINPIINFSVLYKTLGFTWRLIFVWWENLVHHFLRESRKQSRDEENQINPTSTELEEILPCRAKRQPLVLSQN